MGKKLLVPLNERVCCFCGNKETKQVKVGNYYYPYWANYEDKPCCYSCIYQIKYNPDTNSRWNSINNVKNKGRLLRFKNKHLFLKENPRTGQCQWCPKKIGDEFINAKGKKSIVKCTHMHHINYHDTDVLKDAIELCPSCHFKETMRIKKLNKNHKKTLSYAEVEGKTPPLEKYFSNTSKK